MSVTEPEHDIIAESLTGIENDKLTLYLSGPIRKLEDNGEGWRNKIINEYSDSFDFLNPLDRYNPDEEEILNDPINYSEDSEKNQVIPSEYVTSDKIDIAKSDAVFVGLPEVISRGTCMEMQYSYDIGKPFYVWTIDGQEESGWINYHAEVIDDNEEWLLKYIKDELK